MTAVTSGYAGGKEPNPTYEMICAHRTRHAEVIKIDYDPSRVPLERLLEFFWKVHDPTQVGGQGNDQGAQYRSIILYADAAQQEAAERSRVAAQARFEDPITTEIVPLVKTTASLLSQDPAMRDVDIEIDGGAPAVSADAVTPLLRIVRS